MNTTRRDFLAAAVTAAGATAVPDHGHSKDHIHQDVPSDVGLRVKSLESLPRLLVENDGPIFAEPWEAQAFSLAVKLSEQGHFTWKEWAAKFADELKSVADRGEPDDGSRYYHHWLAALERLVIEKNLIDRVALDLRKEAWDEAYRHTPHGRPVELDVDHCDRP
jgi:nitrile hydratase accessory protein